jgi:hypothetical protein
MDDAVGFKVNTSPETGTTWLATMLPTEAKDGALTTRAAATSPGLH